MYIIVCKDVDFKTHTATVENSEQFDRLVHTRPSQENDRLLGCKYNRLLQEKRWKKTSGVFKKTSHVHISTLVSFPRKVPSGAGQAVRLFTVTRSVILLRCQWQRQFWEKPLVLWKPESRAEMEL